MQLGNIYRPCIVCVHVCVCIYIYMYIYTCLAKNVHTVTEYLLYKNAFFICMNLVISSKYFTCTIHAYVLSFFNNQHSIIMYSSCLCYRSKQGTWNPRCVLGEFCHFTHWLVKCHSPPPYIHTFQNCVEETLYRLTKAGLPRINMMSQHLPTPGPTQIKH